MVDFAVHDVKSPEEKHPTSGGSSHKSMMGQATKSSNGHEKWLKNIRKTSPKKMCSLRMVQNSPSTDGNSLRQSRKGRLGSQSIIENHGNHKS